MAFLRLSSDNQDMKNKLREQLSQQRNALSALQKEKKSRQIASHVVRSNVFQGAQNIAFYLSVNAEANPASTQITPFESHKQFYLPVLAEAENQGLLFAPVHQSSEFKLNKFSIPEPQCLPEELITGENLDLVLVPLLGFDKQGNRLGMGGGYYDRSFAFKNTSTSIKPVLMGFAYALQEVPQLQAESWDVKLDYIATENGISQC